MSDWNGQVGASRAAVMARWGRLITLALFACALALRAWVPAGWMPAPGTHSFAIMPCPAADPGPMMHMGHDPARQDHSKGSGDCFSPLLAGAALLAFGGAVARALAGEGAKS